MSKNHCPISVPGTKVALITANDKTGFSWDIPPLGSCPWAETRDLTDADGNVLGSSVCASCYAIHGRERFTAVEKAQDARYNWTVESLKTPEGTREWVSLITRGVLWAESLYGPDFRWHGAGDVFSPAYCDAISKVIANTPHIAHWIPTRSWRALVELPAGVGRDKWTVAFQRLNALPNVTVRVSGLWVNYPVNIDLLPTVKAAGFVSSSGVIKKIPGRANLYIAGDTSSFTAVHGASFYVCPARTQGNKCGNCRVCYRNPELVVGYPEHGNRSATALAYAQKRGGFIAIEDVKGRAA